MAKIILTGDRPTGPLHLGHYVGSTTTKCRTVAHILAHVLARSAIIDADPRSKSADLPAAPVAQVDRAAVS